MIVTVRTKLQWLVARVMGVLSSCDCSDFFLDDDDESGLIMLVEMIRRLARHDARLPSPSLFFHHHPDFNMQCLVVVPSLYLTGHHRHTNVRS